jgi:hypothetical protein
MGTKEYTVPESFRFNVDGKELSVHDLKPGMVAMSTVTTITTVTPVVVTEFRSAKVMQAFGNAVIVRSQDGGFKQITEADAKKRNAKITKDGKVIEFQQLRAGDVISATIVTESAPKVMTEQQVTASIVANGGGEAPKTAGSGSGGEARGCSGSGGLRRSPRPLRRPPRLRRRRNCRRRRASCRWSGCSASDCSRSAPR